MAWQERSRDVGEFLRRLHHEWDQDRVGDVAGALTFFGVLALFPFLLFLLSLASVLIDPSLAKALITELGQVAPPEVVEILAAPLARLGEAHNVGVLTLSALGAVWVASGGMMALIRALNVIHGVRESRPFWKTRLLALGMTVLSAGVGLVALLMAVFLPPLAGKLEGALGAPLLWLRLPAAGLLVAVLWALLYHALPNVQQPLRIFTPGSVAGVLLWVAVSWGFSVYVQSFGKYEATYGALGGVVVFLSWLWLSCIALLLGAEINTVLQRSRPPQAPAPEAAPSGTPADPRGPPQWAWTVLALLLGAWLTRRPRGQGRGRRASEAPAQPTTRLTETPSASRRPSAPRRGPLAPPPGWSG